MDEKKPDSVNLEEEFRQLGRNLTEALHTAWDRPERKKLQGEIANALNELGITLREEAQKVSQSPTGQRLRSEADELRERVRRAEVDNKARDELSRALHSANELLRQAISRLSSERGASGEQAAYDPGERREQEGERQQNPGVPEEDRQSTPMKDTGHREVHPDDVEGTPSAPSERQEVHPDDAE
jgi:hypothetical protein